MKQFFFLTALCFTFTNLYCKETPFSPCEKTYVEASDILINSKGIFVANDDTILQVDSIQHDDNGLFFSNCNDDLTIFWICYKCGYDKNFLSQWCKKCGEHM